MSEATFRTNPHRKVEKILDEMGIEYESEVEIFPPYQLDIYLQEFHLCIEIDGLGHRKKHDQVRDEWMLERYGVPTLRIKARSGLVGKQHLKDMIMAFLETYADSYNERKEIWRALK